MFLFFLFFFNPLWYGGGGCFPSVVIGAVADRRRWVLFFFGFFFCFVFSMLIPSCIKRTDVGKLINKSLGDVELRLHSEAGLSGGEGDVLLDQTQSASQYGSMLTILVGVSVCVCSSSIHSLPALCAATTSSSPAFGLLRESECEYNPVDRQTADTRWGNPSPTAC